ncbi:MAG: hypothetical protein K6G07_04360 [Lachnospiraceae bacterium]|nr:hypothetical protein [Lachnospiraceae bacterium]
MISSERLKLMTKMASYEQGEGKKFMSIGSFFRSDYIGLQIIKAAISATVAFLVIVAMYVFYNFEDLMTDIYTMDLIAFGKNLLMYYAIFTVSYTVICYVVFSIQYHRAKRSLKKYYHRLKQLSAMYDIETK